MLDERQGSSVLMARFNKAGLSMQADHPLEVAGRTIHLDGFDPARKVGFEYITTEAGDRDEITNDVVRELEARMSRGDLYVLLVDEHDVSSAATLERAADHFLRVAATRLGFELADTFGESAK